MRPADGFAHPRSVLALSFLIVPLLAVMADKSTVPTLLAATAIALPGAWSRGWRPVRPTIATLALAATVAGWAAVASLWSFDPANGVSTDIRLLGLVVCAWVLSDIAVRVPDQRDPNGRRLARCATVGVLGAATILLVEMLFHMPVKSTITGLWQAESVDGSETNRGGTFIVIALWLLLPLTRTATDRWWPLAVGLFAVSAAAVAVAESGTNQMALLAGLTFLGLAWLGRTIRFALWSGAIGVGLVAMPWIAQGFFDAGMHEVEQLGTSVQHRIHIWHYVSEWALERPLTGWGFDTSADFSNRGVEAWSGYSSVIPLHPHNAALQIWLELGLVGVLLAGAVVIRVVWGTEASGPGWAPWLGAATMSALVAANLGYGIWQTQWIAGLAWLACYARIAVTITPAGRKTEFS